MKHPSRYSDDVLNVTSRYLDTYQPATVLDPFAGTGRIHELTTPERTTVGVEIEPEWADLHPDTIVGDALALPFDDDSFDAIATSPTFGNRMADHHNAKDSSKRITYKHFLGRDLHANNSGAMQWGDEYRDFHERAWKESVRVLKPGGCFVLNISDHIRRGEVQHVTMWHLACLSRLGLTIVDSTYVATRRMRFGANHRLRAEGEAVVLLEAPGRPTHRS